MITKKIKVIATGGTISAIGKNNLDFKDYQSGKLSGQEIVDQLPLLSGIEVDVEQLENFSSTQMNSSHWIQLKNLVDHYVNKEQYDGVVITHGTNTLEETAYFLHLTIHTNQPVVLVGSQRPFSALSSDGAINLLQAIRVAADDASIGKGVLVVLNDEINCAREVTKTNTYRLETFQSGQLGFLGYVDPDHTVQFYRSPTRIHTVKSIFSTLPLKRLPRVEIVYSYAGADGDIIRYIVNSNQYDGIVVAGTGAGRFSLAEETALVEAVEKGLPVVRSSRVGNGRVVDIDYYKDRQFIYADNLLPQKARVLLMLALLVHKDVNVIQTFFNEY